MPMLFLSQLFAVHHGAHQAPWELSFISSKQHVLPLELGRLNIQSRGTHSLMSGVDLGRFCQGPP